MNYGYEVTILWDGDDDTPLIPTTQPYTFADLVRMIAWALDMGHGIVISDRPL